MGITRGDKRPTEGSIYDIKVVYNSKLVGYTTSMSHTYELCGNSSSFMAHELSTYVNYGGFKW